ncbi:hypothetical protein TSOC_005128 [Tetrabaena socialis]|uniref:Ankyrin repeat domain-containing protein n=1 Tax=Tetrabaena socialis TaxID=47790 RepID=A0A2J8A761_9CHLO|nr:hypothetical protein TSOC_005128 [Tetrabaena socialis]|eukprot:PNH08358.1 hypothetical protein TSOC_005128 [Tetrabaena socialis]
MPDALPRLTWLVSRGYRLNWGVLDQVIGTGNLELVQYVMSQVLTGPTCWWTFRFPGSMTPEILNFIHTAGFVASRPGALRQSARAGNLPAMAWLLKDGDLDEAIFEQAAEGGSMAATVWLHERGCPWDERTFRAAVTHGSEELLEFLAAHGCPMDGTAYASAAKHGNIEMMCCLKRLGCPLTAATFWQGVRMWHAHETWRTQTAPFQRAVRSAPVLA